MCLVVTEGDQALVICEENLEAVRTYQGGCGVDRGTAVAVDITIALAAIYFAATYVLLLLKLRSYRLQAYTSVQVGIVYNTLQVPVLCLPVHPHFSAEMPCIFSVSLS